MDQVFPDVRETRGVRRCGGDNRQTECARLHNWICDIRQYNFAQFSLIASHLITICLNSAREIWPVLLRSVSLKTYFQIFASEIFLTWERSLPQCRAFRHQDFCKRSRPSQLSHPPPSWDIIIFFICWSSEPFPDRGHFFVVGWISRPDVSLPEK